MAVSSQHERLVAHIIRWVQGQYASRGDVCLYADHIDWPRHHKPTSVGGFVPDVYAVGVTEALTIIGEAETAKGIELLHTKTQITAFVEFLEKQVNPVLVIAVPWEVVPTARSLVRNVMRRRGSLNIQSIFLERLA